MENTQEADNMSPMDALATARAIAMQVNLGHMSYNDGKQAVQPYLNIVNAKAREIAKKYNQKPHNIVTFAGLRR